jgi:hypothetical protein
VLAAATGFTATGFVVVAFATDGFAAGLAAVGLLTAAFAGTTFLVGAVNAAACNGLIFDIINILNKRCKQFIPFTVKCNTDFSDIFR